MVFDSDDFFDSELEEPEPESEEDEDFFESDELSLFSPFSLLLFSRARLRVP